MRIHFEPEHRRDSGEEIRFVTVRAGLGHILVAFSEVGIVSIILRARPNGLLEELEDRFPAAHLVRGDADDARSAAAVGRFIESPKLGLDLPLDLRGTAFQRRVWRAVQEIPFGDTSTYGEIARRIGAPHSARAVGNACCRNYLAFAIPCHRVLRSDGSVSGNVDRQEALIAREKAH